MPHTWLHSSCRGPIYHRPSCAIALHCQCHLHSPHIERVLVYKIVSMPRNNRSQQTSGPTEASGAVPPVARPHVLTGPVTVCSAPPGGGVITGPGPISLAGGGAGEGDRHPGAPPSIHRLLGSGYYNVVISDFLKTVYLHASSVHRLRHAAPTVLLTSISRTGGIALSLRHLPAWPGRTVAVGTLWGKT